MSKSPLAKDFTIRPCDGIPIELLVVLKWKGKTYAVLTDGNRDWLLVGENLHMQPFDSFRSHVLERTKVLVTHRSQESFSERQRTRGWNDVVVLARNRGEL